MGGRRFARARAHKKGHRGEGVSKTNGMDSFDNDGVPRGLAAQRARGALFAPLARIRARRVSAWALVWAGHESPRSQGPEAADAQRLLCHLRSFQPNPRAYCSRDNQDCGSAAEEILQVLQSAAKVWFSHCAYAL